jgi:inner membrane protein
MPSVFGHIIASTFLNRFLYGRKNELRLYGWAAFCAFAPDLDVLAFYWDIPYHSPWGHRGFTHSIFFGLLFGALIAWLIARNRADFFKIALVMILATLSHPLLDMMTDGGLGCALWWPLSDTRLFFPFRPIAVSPIGISSFFSPWGMHALASELLCIGVPCTFIYFLFRGENR